MPSLTGGLPFVGSDYLLDTTDLSIIDACPPVSAQRGVTRDIEAPPQGAASDHGADEAHRHRP